MAEWVKPNRGHVDSHEVRWTAPLLFWTRVGLLARVVVCSAVVVWAFNGMAGALTPSFMRSMLALLVAVGAVVGSISGLAKRAVIARAMEEPVEPLASPTPRPVIRGYRPRPASALLPGGFILYVMLTDRWWSLILLAAIQLGEPLGSLPAWYFKANRWERQTGRVLLAARTHDGRMGYGATMPTAEMERIVEGDLGGWGQEWITNLISSLHTGGRYAEAAAVGDHAFARWREPAIAYNVARSLARMGDHDLAVEYLGQALWAGYGRKDMVKEPDLAPLLPRPDVIELFKATKPTT